MQIVLDLKADKGREWFVCLLRCSAALVTLSESCETLLYHFVPPAWLWNLLSRNMRAATLTETRFLVSTLRTLPVVGVEATSPAHSTAVTEFRGLTTPLILQTQPQQWRVAPASHSHKWLAVIPESSQRLYNFKFFSEMISCRGTRGQVPALMSLCSPRREEFLSE